MAANLSTNTNTNINKAGDNMSTNKSNKCVLDAGGKLFIAEKNNLLNASTVKASTIIEHLIVTETKISKQEFCCRIKQQCNVRFYDAIKFWKQYNQKLQPEGYSNDKNNRITNGNNNKNNNNWISKFNQKQ
eukprot:208487_1